MTENKTSEVHATSELSDRSLRAHRPWRAKVGLAWTAILASGFNAMLLLAFFLLTDVTPFFTAYLLGGTGGFSLDVMSFLSGAGVILLIWVVVGLMGVQAEDRRLKEDLLRDSEG